MTMPHSYEHDSPEDVLEHEQPALVGASVPVVVDGLVQVQPVGTRNWSSTFAAVGAINPTQVAQAQPQRSILILEVGTQPVWLGRTEAEARAKTGFKVAASANKQMVMRHREELWALADTATADVSVYQEFWAN